LREVGFRFGEFRAVGARRTDSSKLDVKRLRATRVASCLRGARGAQKTVEAVRGILQDRFVFGEGIGGALEFQEHVAEHFTGGDADGFAAVFILMVGGGAQLLESFVRFSLGECQPGFGFAEVGGFFGGGSVALLY